MQEDDEVPEEPPAKLPRKEDVRQFPRKKAYSQLKRSYRAEVLHFELDKVCRDPQLEDDVRIRLNKRKRKRSSEEERRPTAAFFDEMLACFNGIKSCNLSMMAWDKLRLFLKDYHSLGGDLLKLPSSATLRTYRKCMVPSGLHDYSQDPPAERAATHRREDHAQAGRAGLPRPPGGWHGPLTSLEVGVGWTDW